MATEKEHSTVCIIILNYNGWADTIECLESVLRIEYPKYAVLVVENGSTDNSLEFLKNWADGKLDAWLKPLHPLRHITYPPLKKPLIYSVFSADEFSENGYPKIKNEFSRPGSTNKNRLCLIKSDKNLGFTGGNNIGIRFALWHDDYDFIWLLNNDTVVERNALTNLVKKAQTNPCPGITGSRLMMYDKPEMVQALGGGRVSPIWGTTRHIQSEDELKKMNYIVGASFLISKECVEKAGLLCDKFFVYSDDTDYCLNAARHGFEVSAALDSIVFHREGRATSSFLKNYYGIRNSLYLNLKYFRRYLPTNFLYILLRVFKRLIRFHFKEFLAAARGVFDGIRGKMGKQL